MRINNIGDGVMKLLQLKYFVGVCNHGSLSLASKFLYVTQPTLSTAITTLEKEYNVTLFERKNNMMIITEEGEFFYEKAKRILEIIDIFEADLRDFVKNKTTIRIGVPPMIGSFLFPKIYNQYILEHIGAKFEIWEDGSLSIRQKIMNKTLDLGFSILNDSEHEQYEREVILETELLFCVSKDNHLANKASLSIEDIKDEPIVFMREGFFQTRLINQMFDKVGAKPNIVIVSSQISVLRNFVKMNSGGAFLIKELLEPNDDSIIGIPFEDRIKLKIGLLWQKETTLHGGALEFLEYMKNIQV